MPTCQARTSRSAVLLSMCADLMGLITVLFTVGAMAAVASWLVAVNELVGRLNTVTRAANPTAATAAAPAIRALLGVDFTGR